MRWCSCNFIGFTVCRCCLLSSSGFIHTLKTFVCLSLCEFSQCRMLDFGCCSARGKYSVKYEVSASAVISTSHISKNSVIFFSPCLAPSLESPACTPSLSLHFPSQSLSQWHPFTHPFVSHSQWVSCQRHTFQSHSCFSLCVGERAVCVWLCISFLSYVLWATTTVFDL